VTETVVVDGKDLSVNWWGVSAMARYGIGEHFGVAGRFEFIRDKDGQVTAPNTADMSLITGTLTLEAIPVKSLIIRLDNRLDNASNAVFANRTEGFNKNQFTTTLGLVVKTP
jgi:Putative beta-barrel porin-2, OmpL-like. bbp2